MTEAIEHNDRTCTKYNEPALPTEDGTCSLCGATMRPETIEESTARWISENRNRLCREYRDYLQSMIEAKEQPELIEDWKTWTDREWTRDNIPF